MEVIVKNKPDKDPEQEQWEPSISPRQTSFVFYGMLLVILLAALDQTIVSTALPQIVSEMHGLEYYSWVGTAYMLASAVTVPIYGKLSDIFGRKSILLFGIVVFLSASAWCGTATSMEQLIWARGFQGLGAGALIPVAFATMGNLFSPRQIGKYQGIISIVFVLASVIGPPVGGWITDHSSWRWVFYVNIPVGMLAAGVLITMMPKFKTERESVSIDYLGAALLMLGLGSVLVAFDGAAILATFTTVTPLWLGLGGLALLGAFVVRQFYAPDPIMDPQVFSKKVVASCAIATMLTGATMMGSAFYMPLFLQAVMGFSATFSGNLILPFSIMVGIGAMISGRHATKTGTYRMNAIIGWLFVNAGLLLLMLTIGLNSSAVVFVLSTSVMGLGMGVCVSLYGTIVRNAVTLSQMGQASAGLSLFRQLGGTIGMAVAGMLMNAQLAGASIVRPDEALRAGFALGVHHVYIFLFVVSLVASVCTMLWLEEIPLRDEKKKDDE
jgi:EmrB/QacA subfamily drug resistance transporter